MKSCPRIIPSNAGLHRYVIDSPLSRYAESIRAIKVSADFAGVVKSNKVIGITSSLPDEGKSTVSASLAQLCAHGGARVILVDCDLRKPSLSRDLAPNASLGLIDVLTGTVNLDDVVWSDRSTKLSFLPVGDKSASDPYSRNSRSDRMKRLFDGLRESYDYVIVDLSPLAPVVDVRSATHLLDCYLFVVEWGKTKIDVVEHALNTARVVYENLLGVILNKVDYDRFSRYDRNRNRLLLWQLLHALRLHGVNAQLILSHCRGFSTPVCLGPNPQGRQCRKDPRRFRPDG